MLGACLARNVANSGGGVGFDSHEMTERQVRARLLSDQCERLGSRVPYSAIDRGLIGMNDVDVLKAAAEIIDQMPLIIFDRGNRLDEIPAKIKTARRMLARTGRELVLWIEDYLGLLSPTERYRGNRVAEIGEISAALKHIAMQEGVPILALHQLSRAVEGRKDKRPILSDLRESGSIEQDADTVIFVYREAYYHQRPGYSDDSDSERQAAFVRTQHLLEAIVAKARHGPIGTAELWCDTALNAVRDRQRDSW